VGTGLTLFPFHRKEMRINFQALYESQAPAGSSALPFQSGARVGYTRSTWGSGSEETEHPFITLAKVRSHTTKVEHFHYPEAHIPKHNRKTKVHFTALEKSHSAL